MFKFASCELRWGFHALCCSSLDAAICPPLLSANSSMSLGVLWLTHSLSTKISSPPEPTLTDVKEDKPRSPRQPLLWSRSYPWERIEVFVREKLWKQGLSNLSSVFRYFPHSGLAGWPQFLRLLLLRQELTPFVLSPKFYGTYIKLFQWYCWSLSLKKRLRVSALLNQCGWVKGLVMLPWDPLSLTFFSTRYSIVIYRHSVIQWTSRIYSFINKWSFIPLISNSSSPLPLGPGNHYSILCFYEFDYFRNLM